MISLISTRRFMSGSCSEIQGSDFIPLLLGDAYFRGVLGHLLAHELAEDSEIIPGMSGVDGRLKKLAGSIGHSRIDPTVA
jgi:hypothetical protein